MNERTRLYTSYKITPQVAERKQEIDYFFFERLNKQIKPPYWLLFIL